MAMENKSVEVRTEKVIIPTYLPAAPDKNPMFLEKRVYQGSSGKVYPLPFTDRIAETKTDHEWQAIYIENEYLQVMILPEIGGRIHAILDKTNGYDLIYRQPVIKPALVGLAGSWISGGIEFNWAQHHRPATFLPVNFEIEAQANGSQIVWLSDHEPMSRMKGMHGVCLSPGKALVELKVRVYNRTPLTQTFLWWANVATKVHEGYQSFFPPDVAFVADHAKRAMSEYPFCNGFYYGVNYGERAKKGVPIDEIPSKFVPPHCRESKNSNTQIPTYAPNDLSWYANIPVPTSYMCPGSTEDFFGGYDYYAQAGIVHIADHHIAPGKKQWTWGNHEFGYAWDRNLSDDAAPYIELMAGVFTDNQPDFSYLTPFETKSWSQYWYGISRIGVPVQANTDAAVSISINEDLIKIGVGTTAVFDKARITFESAQQKLEWTNKLAPDQPFVIEIENNQAIRKIIYKLSVFDKDGVEIISYTPQTKTKVETPLPAAEPLLPDEIKNSEGLFLTGLHLEQYRHATRQPEDYWREALKRDESDSRSNNALGLFHLRRGEFKKAESYFRQAVKRLTALNPNPADGDVFYNLGLCLRLQADNSRFEEAYSAFYKATWNSGQSAAAFMALAEMDCFKGKWKTAAKHLKKSLASNNENLWARNLMVLVQRRSGHNIEAESLLVQTLKLDALDWTARFLNGERLLCDAQLKLDIAHDLARAGFFTEAIEILTSAIENSFPKEFTATDLPTPVQGAEPLIFYTLGWLYKKINNTTEALEYFRKAAQTSSDYCFPYRLEEIEIFQTAMRENPADAYAPYYLGNLLYDRRRHTEAIQLWERSKEINPAFSIVWRNLGTAYFNIEQDAKKAHQAYDEAFRANPNDARLLYERDQLWKRIGESPEKRRQELEKHLGLVSLRDDLTIEMCALDNQTKQHEKALNRLQSRRFQPWEGGEGQTLEQYTRTHLALGKRALKAGSFEMADKHFAAALDSPENLGEARHLLANQSDVFYWRGISLKKLGDKPTANEYWEKAASFKGDFQEMSVCEFSEMTYYSALALQKLQRNDEAQILLRNLLIYAEQMEKTEAKIDYFATSLPTMLLFEDDIQLRRENTALFLQAQAYLGLGETIKAQNILQRVLERNPNHALAADLFEEINEKDYEKVSN